MKRFGLAALSLIIGIQPLHAGAEEAAPPREKIRVEWAPLLSPLGFIVVKGNEAVPLGESFSESGTIRRMLEDCSQCRMKVESSRKNSRTASILSGFALGGILGGFVLFSAHEKVGMFLPVAVTVTGYGLLYPAMNLGRSAQQDLFDAVRIYNAQAP
ncbi:MAG: hypothetical protein HYT87_03565 [Nitrospirae bacterium]|nr:hypothetical protein [Nitrospirota bacterium]